MLTRSLLRMWQNMGARKQAVSRFSVLRQTGISMSWLRGEREHSARTWDGREFNVWPKVRPRHQCGLFWATKAGEADKIFSRVKHVPWLDGRLYLIFIGSPLGQKQPRVGSIESCRFYRIDRKSISNRPLPGREFLCCHKHASSLVMWNTCTRRAAVCSTRIVWKQSCTIRIVMRGILHDVVSDAERRLGPPSKVRDDATRVPSLHKKPPKEENISSKTYVLLWKKDHLI